jgi:DNA-binding CsgD family transcriptional regulator
MRDENNLHALIDEIYDAALDAARWPHVLATCVNFVGGAAAAIFVKNCEEPNGYILYAHGISASFRKNYSEQYVQFEPIGSAKIVAGLESQIATNELISCDKFLAPRVYREWARPQGLIDFVGSTLDRSSETVVTFGVFRNEMDGVIDDEVRARVRMLVPHIRRALLIGSAIDSKKAQVSTFAATLDGLSAGVFLVSSAGRIVYANPAANDILYAGALLTAVNGKLGVTDEKTNNTLHALIEGLTKGEIKPIGIHFPLIADDGERYIAHVLPLGAVGQHASSGAHSAVAAVFVRKAAAEALPPPELIAATYRLTPAELRVLLAILEIGGVPEVAVALNVAETTVKTHLGRLFEKTGVRRQADLVKLAAGFISPLASDSRARRHQQVAALPIVRKKQLDTSGRCLSRAAG